MIQSVQRALMLLNTVAQAGDWIGVRELSRLTGLRVTTAQQLLKTLQHEGFLEFDEKNRRYRIGYSALMLGQQVDKMAFIRDSIRPEMDRFAQDFNETIAAIRLDGDYAVIVDWRESSHMLTLRHQENERIHFPHYMASGCVLLAYQDEQFRQAYARRVNYGGVNPVADNPDALLELFEKIRKQGYFETANVNNSGIAAIGGPVFNRRGEIVLSIGCSVPLVRKTPEIWETMRRGLVSTCTACSHNFGYKPGGSTP